MLTAMGFDDRIPRGSGRPRRRMTQLFSNELQRLSQGTEGAFAEDDHGSTTPGGTIGRSGDAMPPLLGRADLGQQHLDPRHSVVSTATLEHPKERPRWSWPIPRATLSTSALPAMPG
jgi:hypothetical protein